MEVPDIKSHKIEVSKEIIEFSKKTHRSQCMVAQAIRRDLPGAWSVKVTSDTIKFNIGGEGESKEQGFRYCYDTPGRVGLAIAKFDSEGPGSIEPFSFKLDARQGLVAPIIKKGSQKKSTHKKGAKRENLGKRCAVRRYHGLAVVTAAKEQNDQET
jgi:hypothetical protein